MIEVYTHSKAKDGSKPLSANFTVEEFACRDGSDVIFIAPISHRLSLTASYHCAGQKSPNRRLISCAAVFFHKNTTLTAENNSFPSLLTKSALCI